MNKKVEKKKKVYDDKEDLNIRNAAYYKGSSQILLLIVLIILFGFTLFNSLMYIGKYYINKNKLNDGAETINIKNSKNNVTIINNGNINNSNSGSGSEEELIITKVSSIELQTNIDEKKDGEILFDVKYNILKNDYPGSSHSNLDSGIKVRFAYSYDNKNWTYVNNVISTYDTTITSLTGSYYDISGITNTLKVVTNYKLTSTPGNKQIMYWKSETIIENKDEYKDKVIDAQFKIDFKDSL